MIKSGIAASTGFNLSLSGIITSNNILCYYYLSVSGGIYSNSIMCNNITSQNIISNLLTISGITSNSLATNYLRNNGLTYLVQNSNLPSVFIGDNNYYDPVDYGMLSITRYANTNRPHIAFIRAGHIVAQMGFLESFTNYANNF